MELPSTLARFPAQQKIAERVVSLLERDERVIGIYLSGSFARGKPDMYSDLDFNILVSAEVLEETKKDHGELREQVGEIVSDFPATHLGDPNQFVALYRERYPVHVDYQYRITGELTPRKTHRGALILLDRSGELQDWQDKCTSVEESYSPAQQDLQYFEDRFWVWCVYTDSKIRRGELWEARDAIEHLRSNVLVRLAYYVDSLHFEGNRRIETRFPNEAVKLLESTLPSDHSQRGYAEALVALADAYIELMRQATSRFHIGIQERDREYLYGAIAGR